MKLKRLFTAILSAALTLSLCAMPAMADSTATGAAGTTRADGTPVWDTTKKGSITIHKFEYNPTPKQPGTGAEGETVPDGAKELGGVTFEIYKVQDQTWLESYYGGGTLNTTDKLSATDYYTTGTDGKITLKGTPAPTPVRTVVTDADTGVVTADGLDFGLYLVVETKAPDKVKSPAAPFLVSVPMTRIDNTTTTNKLTDWIYDVHVYPKNATTYAGITIYKSGYTGGTSDGPLSGVEFVLEKLSTAADGTKTWTPVTKHNDTGVAYNLKTNDSGNIVIEGLSQGKYHIYEKSYTTPNGYILDAAYHEFTVDSSGEITYGGNSASKSVTISLENYRPDMKKQVFNGTDWEQDAQYGVGDTVPYKITIEVPKNIEKLSTFIVTDTPTGLTDNVSSIKIKADTTALTSGTDYTVAPEGTAGFKIKFKCTSENVKACAGRTVTITYDAVVKDSAVVGRNGNLNNAKLEYTNKIESDGVPDTTTNTIEDSAVMYSLGIKVVKTAGDTTNALQGVVFDLYRVTKPGETPTVTAEAVKKAGLDKTKSWILVKSGLTTDKTGVIDTSDFTNTTNYTHGLANGDYYLVETKTAEGYNLLTTPVKVELHVTTITAWQRENVYDGNGNLVKHGTVQTTTFANSENDKSALVVANIINRKGFTLPVTGGFGTLLFSGIGLLLVLVGVSVLFSLKKKNNRA